MDDCLKNKIRNIPLPSLLLLLASFIFAFASFMVNPYIGIYVKKYLGYSVEDVSLILACATFVQFGGGILGGMFSESIGHKYAMVVSLMMRIIGLLLLANCVYYHLLIFPALFLIVGAAAIYVPANKGYLVTVSDVSLRPLIISLSNVSFNVGMSLGPLLGVYLMTKNSTQAFYSAAMVFLLLFFYQLFFIKNINYETKYKLNIKELFLDVCHVKHAFLFNVFVFYLYFYFQNFYLIFLDDAHFLKTSGIFISVNFLVLFLVQILFSQKISSADNFSIKLISILFVIVGFFSLSFLNLITQFLGVVILSAGLAILLLRGDLDIVSKLPNRPAIGFGIQRLAAGIGGLLTGVIGGPLYKNTSNLDLLSFWRVVALQAFVCIFMVMFQRYRHERSNKIK
jgi:predicted MFS family arabinose efflux permease